MEQRQEDGALLVLGGANVLKGAGEHDWRCFAATVIALLDRHALATLPIMDYIYGKLAAPCLDEKFGRLFEGDDGTAEIVRLIAAAAWPEGDVLAEENCAWTDRFLLAAVLSPRGSR